VIGADFVEDLAVVGKRARFILRVDQPILDAHVEHSVAAGDELGVDVEGFV
jgi:hypothetical protein